MNKKKIKDIFLCVIIVVAVLTLSIIATNRLSKDDSDTSIDSPIINAGKEKNNDTFCGVLITSGTSKVNTNQHELLEKQKVYADFDKENYELTFEGIEGIIYADAFFDKGDNRYTAGLFDKHGIHGDCSIECGGDKDGNKIKTTIYAYLNEKYYIYVNPIYEESEGKYYVVASDEPKELDKVDEKRYYNDYITIGTLDTIEVKSADYCNVDNAKYLFELEAKIEYRKLTEKLDVIAFDKDNNKLEQKSYEIKGEPIKVKTTKNADYYVVKEYNGKGKVNLDITKADCIDYTYYYSTTGAFLDGANIDDK